MSTQIAPAVRLRRFLPVAAAVVGLLAFARIANAASPKALVIPRPRRRAWRLLPLALMLLVVSFPSAAFADQPAGTAPPASDADPIIDNGSLVQLGINPEGHLNVSGGTPSMPSSSTTNVGLRYVPTNGEATAPGCLCEGWGAGNADAATGAFSGYANVSSDGGVHNLAVQPGTGVYAGPPGEVKARPESVGTRFRSVVTISGRLRVTQDYRPSPLTANLYEDVVTMENIGATAIGDLRYRRVMDWDIAPYTFSEFSEIHVGTSTALVVATTDGFMTANPLGSPGPYVGVPPTTLHAGSPDYLSGPADQGALFDFRFGALAPGELKQFRIFYGAAESRPAALAAVVAVAAEVYSLGLPRHGDGTVAPEGPHAFVFAFSGVGGEPISDIALSPGEATNRVGESHVLTATVEEDGAPIVGTPVGFRVVSGPNAGSLGSALTNAAGVATLSYASALPGTDVIEASYVTATGRTVLSNRVTKIWTRPLDADLQLVSNVDSADPVLHGDTFSYTMTVRNNGPAAATGVVVTDTLPAGLSFVGGGACTAAGPIVTCPIGALAVGASASVTFAVHADAAGLMVDSASVAGDQPDLSPGNNALTESTTVNAVAALSVAKSGTISMFWGQDATYTIVVSNAGPDEATGVEMTDAISRPGTFVSGTAAGGACTLMAGLVHCPVGAIAAGDSSVVTLVVNGYEPGIIVDKAHATGREFELDLTDNAAEAATNVLAHPTSITYTGATTSDYHDPAVLSAQLADDLTGALLSGTIVDFALDAQSCSDATNARGVASCTITPNQPAGGYPLTATYAGGFLYDGSLTSRTFVVTKEQTVTVYTGATAPVQNLTSLLLSATLKEDGTTPIAGRPVALTIGTGVTQQWCVDTTNASGVASCSILISQPTGIQPLSAAFAGDEYYLASSDSSSVQVATLVITCPASGCSGTTSTLNGTTAGVQVPGGGSAGLVVITTEPASSNPTLCGGHVCMGAVITTSFPAGYTAGNPIILTLTFDRWLLKKKKGGDDRGDDGPGLGHFNIWKDSGAGPVRVPLCSKADDDEDKDAGKRSERNRKTNNPPCILSRKHTKKGDAVFRILTTSVDPAWGGG